MALPTVYHGVQRRWVRKAVLAEVRKGGGRQTRTPRRRSRRTKARSDARRWEDAYPKAVACMRGNLDDLLACFRCREPDQRRQVKATNAAALPRNPATNSPHGCVPGQNLCGPRSPSSCARARSWLSGAGGETGSLAFMRSACAGLPASAPARVTLGSEPGTADRSKKNCACNPDPISGFNTDQRLILIRRVRFGHRPHARGPTSL